MNLLSISRVRHPSRCQNSFGCPGFKDPGSTHKELRRRPTSVLGCFPDVARRSELFDLNAHDRTVPILQANLFNPPDGSGECGHKGCSRWPGRHPPRNSVRRFGPVLGCFPGQRQALRAVDVVFPQQNCMTGTGTTTARHHPFEVSRLIVVTIVLCETHSSITSGMSGSFGANRGFVPTESPGLSVTTCCIRFAGNKM